MGGHDFHAAVAGTELETAAEAVLTGFQHVSNAPSDVVIVGVAPNPANPMRRRIKLTIAPLGAGRAIGDDAFAVIETRGFGARRFASITWLHDDGCSQVPAGCCCGLGLLQELRSAFETAFHLAGGA